jgi:meromycolic acid enoyl-[acyl-carrier protein] reductase
VHHDTALLAGKRILVTGVVTRGSIAFHVVERAQQSGAEVPVR